MVFDRLEHAKMYEGATKRMPQAFAFLRRTDLASLAVGKYPIDGDNIFALVQEYQTKPVNQAKWESHRQYLDVQYIASGVEQMGYGHISDLEVTQDYDAAADYLLYAGTGSELIMTPGTFAIFSPQDAHRPTVAVNDTPSPVRKIVVKVRVD